MNEIELRKSFMVIDALSKDRCIASIKTNMYVMSVGPYHHDFAITMDNKGQGRISFDLKLSHSI